MALSLHSSFLAILLSFGSAAATAQNPATVTGDLLSTLAERYREFSPLPHPAEPSLMALNCESAHRWSGHLEVVRCEGDRINQVIPLPREYLDLAGNYVLSIKWVPLKLIKQRVLEVYTGTHMGNGEVWLFSVQSSGLKTLMHAGAFDRHRDGLSGPSPSILASEVFRNDVLKLKYPDRAHPERLVLTGICDRVQEDGRVIDSNPVVRRWSWDFATHTFLENRPTVARD